MLVGILLSAGCKKKTEDAVKPSPTVSIDTVSGVSSKSSGYFSAGDAITLKYSVTTGENISSIVISESPSSGAAKPSVTKSADFDAPTSHKGSYTTVFPADVATLTITVKVTDTKGGTSSVAFTAKTAVTKTDQLLGAQGNITFGSYYSSLEGVAYPNSDFEANKNKIDITFGEFGSSLTPMLISSDQRTIDGVSSGTGGLKTYFKLSTLAFDGVTPSQLAALSPSTDQKIAIQTTPNVVYEFVCPTLGTKGLIKINLYTAGGANPTGGTIKFDIKVIH